MTLDPARRPLSPRGMRRRRERPGGASALRIITRRLLVLPLVLLAIAAMTFLLVALSPFDPASAYTSPSSGTSEQTRREILAAWDLDGSMLSQFGHWLGNLVRGDLGNSRLLAGQPVAQEIAARALPSVVLVLTALALVLVGGLVLGVLAAAFRDSLLDWTVRTLCYYGTAAPSFWIGLLLLSVFSIQLGWLPSGGSIDVRSADAAFIDPAHLILPAITLAITQQSWFTLFVRDTLLEVLREDYVRYAEASGVHRTAVLARHALPNALIPFITLTGSHLAELIGGAVLAETIFAWPGVGRLTVEAALVVDLPLLVAITLLGAVLVVLGNLVADLLYRVADPRIREGLT
ncbi:MAG: ABC transporter permease [Pseudonocardiaceae bacterium]